MLSFGEVFNAASNVKPAGPPMITTSRNLADVAKVLTNLEIIDHLINFIVVQKRKKRELNKHSATNSKRDVRKVKKMSS